NADVGQAQANQRKCHDAKTGGDNDAPLDRRDALVLYPRLRCNGRINGGSVRTRHGSTFQFPAWAATRRICGSAKATLAATLAACMGEPASGGASPRRGRRSSDATAMAAVSE